MNNVNALSSLFTDCHINSDVIGQKILEELLKMLLAKIKDIDEECGRALIELSLPHMLSPLESIPKKLLEIYPSLLSPKSQNFLMNSPPIFFALSLESRKYLLENNLDFFSNLIETQIHLFCYDMLEKDLLNTEFEYKFNIPLQNMARTISDSQILYKKFLNLLIEFARSNKYRRCQLGTLRRFITSSIKDFCSANNLTSVEDPIEPILTHLLRFFNNQAHTSLAASSFNHFSPIISNCVNCINECLEISTSGPEKEGETVDVKGNIQKEGEMTDKKGNPNKLTSENICDVSLVLCDGSVRWVLMSLIVFFIMFQKNKSRCVTLIFFFYYVLLFV
jgi:hypothetical protein